MTDWYVTEGDVTDGDVTDGGGTISDVTGRGEKSGEKRDGGGGGREVLRLQGVAGGEAGAVEGPGDGGGVAAEAEEAEAGGRGYQGGRGYGLHAPDLVFQVFLVWSRDHARPCSSCGRYQALRYCGGDVADLLCP